MLRCLTQLHRTSVSHVSVKASVSHPRRVTSGKADVSHRFRDSECWWWSSGWLKLEFCFCKDTEICANVHRERRDYRCETEDKHQGDCGEKNSPLTGSKCWTNPDSVWTRERDRESIFVHQFLFEMSSFMGRKTQNSGKNIKINILYCY